MATESELNQTIRRLEKSFEDANRNNKEIDVKVEALKRALTSVNQAKNSAIALESSLKHMNISSRWKGKRRNGFDKACEEELPNDIRNYRDSIDDLYRAIQAKIMELNKNKNHFVSLLSGIDNQIDSAQRALCKLLQNS